MTSVPELLTYPLMAVDAPQAIARIADWVLEKRHNLEKQFSIEWLATELRKGLREGRLALAQKAVEAAYKYDDEIADAALREVGAELQMHLLQKRDLEPGHLQVIAYFQHAGRQDRHKRGRGNRWQDNWMRNLQICVLAELACHEFGVSATRNRASRRADRHPSGISLVVAGLARNGLHLDEGGVQQNLWFALPGELARGLVATYLKTRNIPVA